MAFDPTPDEIADRWVDARDRVREFMGQVVGDDLHQPVPGTPKWTVIELLSHVVGSPIDLANGNFDGAGGPDWTQAQVEARRGRGPAEILAEWDDAVAEIVTKIRASAIPAPVTYDVITHEQDLRGVLRLEPLPDPKGLSFMTNGFASRLERVVAKAGLPPLQLVDPDSGWTAGEAGGVTWTGPQFEFFRGMTGRRSNAQVAKMDWSDDVIPYLPLISVFGDLPEVDVVD